MSIIVAPSLLSADFGQLAADVKRVEQAGADWLHLDVMDGHFVPNITIGPVVIQGVKKYSTIPLDTHLMIENPERYIEAFARAGSDYITVHVEAVSKPLETIGFIKSFGVKAGLSISPDTPADALFKYLEHLDLALIMTVYPGFGGQKLIERCVPKIQALKAAAGQAPVIIGVDGGATVENSARLRTAGAQMIVAGTAVFKATDARQAIQAIKGV